MASGGLFHKTKSNQYLINNIETTGASPSSSSSTTQEVKRPPILSPLPAAAMFKAKLLPVSSTLPAILAILAILKTKFPLNGSPSSSSNTQESETPA